MAYMCLSVAARPHRATQTGASNFGSSCWKIMGCAIPNTIQICQRLSDFGLVCNSEKTISFVMSVRPRVTTRLPLDGIL